MTAFIIFSAVALNAYVAEGCFRRGQKKWGWAFLILAVVWLALLIVEVVK